MKASLTLYNGTWVLYCINSWLILLNLIVCIKALYIATSSNILDESDMLNYSHPHETRYETWLSTYLA